ncbi:MAG TPA: hypothetical protein VFB72_07350 [Verrucomicrobiae bacterium]|nr:hypothetical protein [Verrucomicrobiae bacterium]
MRSSGPLRHFVLAFAIALVLYFISYSYIENRRTRHGPWEVTFTNEANVPELVINEPKLNITNLKIIFPGEPPASTDATLVFAQPQPVPFSVPFGQCLFEDTTFQPGTIVFVLFKHDKSPGHQIQLMPRVLTIDNQEHAWQSNQTISVSRP